MKLYKVSPDYKNFLAFSLPIKDLIVNLGKDIPPKKLLHFYKHNLSLSEKWPNMTASFHPVEGITESSNLPDISTWVPGTLIMSENSRTALSDLNGIGEFLPVSTNNGNYWIFNCMTITPADETNSSRVMESGQVLDVETLAFNPEDINGKHLFKTDYNGFRDLFCTEEFKRMVLDEKLEGLLFSDNLASGIE